jgi:Fe-S-cluster containining protein
MVSEPDRLEKRQREALERLLRLHREVDEQADALAGRHRERLECRLGCTDCCIDGIRVFDIEAERIRRGNAELLGHGEPHPTGACAFLDGEGACRIYEDRPYVCRTQGLPLRWTEPAPGGGGLEMRDICPLNAGGEPVETLAAEDCWSVGPVEARLAALQERWGDGRTDRVPLCDLFTTHPIKRRQSSRLRMVM